MRRWEQEAAARRLAEAHLAEAQKLTHTGSIGWNVATGEHIWSQETLRIFEYDASTKITTPLILERVHPEDRTIVQEMLECATHERRGFDYEHRLLMPDGSVRHLHVVARAFKQEPGNVEFIGAVMDVTGQKQAEESLRRLNRELRAISNCSQTLMRATDEQTLLRQICRIVCEEAGYRMAWVGYAEHDEAKRVRPVAWAGVEEGYLANLGITWADTERGWSPTGTAIRSGKTCYIQDFATDPRLAPWRESVLQHSLLSGIALPLKDEHGNAFGSLSVYSAQPNAFTPEEIRMLEELAGDMAFGIVTLRSRAAREQAEQKVSLLSFAMDNVREAALLIDDSGHFQYVNEEACRVLGYTRAQLLGMGVSDIDPEFPAERWSDHWQGLKVQRSLSYESRHRTQAGRTFPVEISANYFEYGGRPYNLAFARDITERKRAEETLGRSEAYLAESERLAHTGSWALDLASNKYVYVSEEDYRIWAFDPQQGLPTKEAVLQRIHPEDRNRWMGNFEKSLREKLDSLDEYRIVLPDGTIKHIRTIRHPVLNDAGDLVKLVGITIDITERKHTEEALRLSNAYNRSLIEASLDPLVTIGPDGKITDVNGATEAATGRSRGELIGSDFCDYFTEPAHARAGYEQVFREGTVRDYPLELRHRSGCVMSVVYNASVYRDESGRVIGVFAAARDITERKGAEEAVRESETRFRTFVDHATDAFFMLDFEQGTIIDVNQPACESLGYSREELIGKTPLAFDVNLDQATLDAMEERTAAGETVLFDRHWHRRKDGSRFPVEVHTSLFWRGGRRFLLKVARDISDRVRAEEAERSGEAERRRAEIALQEARAELERVSRVTTMGALTASIAHEVNQPLAGVVTSANAGLNWLAKSPPNLLKTREAIERILRDGNRAGEVLNRIRTLLKKTSPTKTRLSVNQIVRDVMALTGDELRLKNVAFSMELDSSLPAIVGDSIQLQQVLLNLIMNAIEAMASITNRRKTLRIQSEPGDLDGKPAVTVKVSDTGIGLSTADTGRLFEAFHTTKAEGMGMGLWISRSIIEGHGGRLTAQSNDGPGATFQVLLPAETGGSE
ncbi:MAG: PAS domain S-box protein [Verrucomicrobiota bacterium]